MIRFAILFVLVAAAFVLPPVCGGRPEAVAAADLLLGAAVVVMTLMVCTGRLR